VLLIGAFFTWQQLRATREGQVTDRYTKAVDQLGNRELAVRLGGIYALQRIAHDSPRDRDTIAEILCTYARTAKRESPLNQDLKSPTHVRATIVRIFRSYAWTVKRESPSDKDQKSPPLDQWAPDVQAALTIVGFWEDRVVGMRNGETSTAVTTEVQILRRRSFRTAISMTRNCKMRS
jgi:hypothetical protein